MKPVDFYLILEVHRDASQEVIKAAYKTLCGKYHPDRDNSPASVAKFKEVQRAFQILSDADSRRRYDMNPEAFIVVDADTTAIRRVDGSSTYLTLGEHLKRHWQESERCDLSNRDFSGVSFKQAKLSGARLDGSRFVGCDFRGADLSNVSANRCWFDNANFAGAKIANAAFSQSRIRGARFYSVGQCLRSSNPSPHIRFTYSDISRMQMTSEGEPETPTVIIATDFTDADLSGSQFAAPTQLKEAIENSKSSFGTRSTIQVWFQQSFVASRISNCTFTRAALIGCRFTAIDLKSSVMNAANLYQAALENCDLGGIDLSTAHLLDTNLTNCIYSGGTRFPEGFSIPIGAYNSDSAAEDKRKAAEKFKQEMSLEVLSKLP